jgi:hypothetical protein
MWIIQIPCLTHHPPCGIYIKHKILTHTYSNVCTKLGRNRSRRSRVMPGHTQTSIFICIEDWSLRCSPFQIRIHQSSKHSTLYNLRHCQRHYLIHKEACTPDRDSNCTFHEYDWSYRYINLIGDRCVLRRFMQDDNIVRVFVEAWPRDLPWKAIWTSSWRTSLGAGPTSRNILTSNVNILFAVYLTVVSSNSDYTASNDWLVTNDGVDGRVPGLGMTENVREKKNILRNIRRLGKRSELVPSKLQVEGITVRVNLLHSFGLFCGCQSTNKSRCRSPWRALSDERTGL